MTILTPPKVLREKLGDDGVDALVDLVNKANEGQKEDIIVIVEEKFEKRLMEVKTELQIEIAKIDAKIDGLESRLDAKIAHAKYDMIKWMFIFWAGQTAILAGLILAFMKSR